MEAAVIVFKGRTFRCIGGHVYRDGEEVIKLPGMYPFSEYRLFQLFHELAPQYSPGPVSTAAVNGRNGVLMHFAGAAVTGDGKLESVMGFLQSIHCVLLVSSHMAMRGLRVRHVRKRGEGADVQFRLVHVSSWVKMDQAWRNNYAEIERLWKDMGWANVTHEEHTDPEIVREMVARAEDAVGSYASEFNDVPAAMHELRCAIEETAEKVDIDLFLIYCCDGLCVTHWPEISVRWFAGWVVPLAALRGAEERAGEDKGNVLGSDGAAPRKRAQARHGQGDLPPADARRHRRVGGVCGSTNGGHAARRYSRLEGAR